MSNTSNNYGRAYEFACLTALWEAIKEIRMAQTIHNSSYEAAKNAWNTLTKTEQHLFTISAKSTLETILALEPNITEKSDGMLSLYIQNDKQGEEADVRDIIIERKDICWQIGLSIKHNNMAVKHSRIAKTLDFGLKWYGVPCSSDYWNDVAPIFDFLEKGKEKRTLFNELPSKEETIYIPLLKAFVKEISTQVNKDRNVPRKLVEYLLSRYDFYKVVSVDASKLTTIQAFDMYGTLNLPSKTQEPAIKVSSIRLPTYLMFIGFKPDSKTTVLACFDNGWQFSFRIHNAKEEIETSLKFDIRIVGVPADVNIKFNCKWDDEFN